MESKTKLLVSVVGPTAVGKTSFSIELARSFHTDIVSVDSRQFYRETEIGTAKPSKEELAKAKHHFINTRSIKDYYNAGQFEQDALQVLENLFKDHKMAIAVGGSGLYFKALWEGMDEMPEIKSETRESLNELFKTDGLEKLLEELYSTDPAYYDQVDRMNHQRVIRALEVIRTTGQPFSSFRKGSTPANRSFRNLKIGLEMERDVLFDRINLRMDQMISNGLFEEAERLYPDKHLNALQTVGYSEIFGFLEGAYDKEEAIRLLKRNSRRYAKRQMTWFKKDPEIHWIHPDGLQETIRMIQKELNT